MADESIRQIEIRLERIEKSISAMTEMLLTIARVEERQNHVSSQIANINSRLNRHSDRIDNLERSNSSNSVMARWVERLLLAIVSGIAVYLSTRV